MLHIVHLIERRFPGRAGAARIALASLSALALGLGLTLL